MENKYYTPEIEEFHVGFEYEVFQKGEPYDPNFMYLMVPQTEDAWYKFKFPDPFLGFNLDKIFKTYKLRVKYLDKEDIESLGFIQDSIYSFKKGDWIIEVNINELPLKTDTLDIYLIADCRFKGYIKNKSELKRVLKQLGIND